jgi:hypothetical protein
MSIVEEIAQDPSPSEEFAEKDLQKNINILKAALALGLKLPVLTNMTCYLLSVAYYNEDTRELGAPYVCGIYDSEASTKRALATNIVISEYLGNGNYTGGSYNDNFMEDEDTYDEAGGFSLPFKKWLMSLSDDEIIHDRYVVGIYDQDAYYIQEIKSSTPTNFRETL